MRTDTARTRTAHKEPEADPAKPGRKERVRPGCGVTVWELLAGKLPTPAPVCAQDTLGVTQGQIVLLPALHASSSCQHAYVPPPRTLPSETTNQLKASFYTSPCWRCFVTATEKKLTHYPSSLAFSSSWSSLLSPQRTLWSLPPLPEKLTAHLMPRRACLQCSPRAPGLQGLALALRCLPTTKPSCSVLPVLTELARGGKTGLLTETPKLGR